MERRDPLLVITSSNKSFGSGAKDILEFKFTPTHALKKLLDVNRALIFQLG